MKKVIVVAAAGAAVFALVNKRKKAAEAEAKLWDEATGQTTPPSAPVPPAVPVECSGHCGGHGDVAQLAEHRLCKAGVGGSIPLVSTFWCCRGGRAAVGADGRDEA